MKVWSIEASRVSLTPQLESNNQFEEALTALMRSAVINLGLDPLHHNVQLQQHQLLIFEGGKAGAGGKPYIHNFDNNKSAGIHTLDIFYNLNTLIHYTYLYNIN
jgi:hypothetical protein